MVRKTISEGFGKDTKMRVIAGLLKGRKLNTPKNYDIRPTTDKVKEAVFSMLIPYIDEDTVFADVFAGRGGIGIEAISRGAAKVYFSDSSRESLSLVRGNLSYCGVSDKAVLLLGDFRQNIKRIREDIDIYFLDPPYADGFILPALEAIDFSGNAKPGCIAVCEHSFRDKLPDEAYGFKLIKDKKYGSIGVSLYERI